MACSIDATVSGASANSYTTIAAADAYHDDHLYGTDWSDSDADTKCRALVMATRLLDYWFEWGGSVTTIGQRLMWPREGVIGPNGLEEASDAIPDRIADATAEWARLLIASDLTADSDIEAQGIGSLKAGPVYLTFRGAVAKPVPDAVQVAVSVYGRKRARSGSVQLLRG